MREVQSKVSLLLEQGRLCLLLCYYFTTSLRAALLGNMRPQVASQVALATALTTVSAQFIPAPTDLTNTTGFLDFPVRYKQVPDGICELTPGVKSYSGYVDIEDQQHIFWWFFEARNEDPSTAPLTVWINGGPGSSSMIGLFQENGPCGVNSDGEVYYNPHSWK